MFELALRAALFPSQKGKNPIRPRSYPVDDSIDYTGIVFPTPVKQMDKLEAQNANLAINVFGWENDHVIVHRVSKKEAHVPRINLMLIASGEKRHYCFVERLSALLFDQTKSHHTKHYCVMCLTGFTTEDLLVNHKKYCNGVKGRPTRIEMPEEGKNILSYADFEALVRKFHLCEHGPQQRASKSYTEKTEWHEASGYSYMVLRSDGEVTGSKVYRGENAGGMFLSDIVQEEAKIREIFAAPKPIAMTNEVWQKHKNATECHICDKSLKKDNFFDSMPVYDHNTGSHCGQSHKKCHYFALKQMEFIGTKNARKARDGIDEWIAKTNRKHVCSAQNLCFRKTIETQ